MRNCALGRTIQYAAASRFKSLPSVFTGCPAFAGHDELRHKLVGRFRRAESLAQRRLVNFAGRIPRQRIDEFDQPRAFEARQIGRAMGVNFRRRQSVAGLWPLADSHAVIGTTFYYWVYGYDLAGRWSAFLGSLYK